MFEFFLMWLAIYLAFLVVRRRLFPNRKPPLDIDQYLASEGVARFLDDCVSAGFPRTFAQDFVRALVAGSGYPDGIEAPSFQQNLFQHWGLNDDLHEIVNQLLPSELAKLPWNDPALRKLQTIFDLMTFIQSESSRPASNPDHPAPSLPRRHLMGIFQDLSKRVFRQTPLPPPAIMPRQQIPVPIRPSITRSTYDQIKSNLMARVYFSHHIHGITNETDALVCTVDSNGYLREKALRYLMEHYQPSYANRILLRLSDWVWPIRTLAESWFIMHMETFSLRDLDKEVNVLCFVFRKPSIKTTPVYAAFAEHLHRKMCAARKQHFYKLSIQFRKLIYEILQARNIDILEYLKTEPAPVLMAIPFAQKAANLPDDYLEAIIDSSTWAVKSKLYDYYIRNNSRPPERFLRDSLAASSYAVRSMAKHYLQLPEAELADLYLSLDHPKRLYVSDLRRECDREFLVDAFRSGASRDREILFEYFLEKDKSVFTQDTLMELYFGGTKLRGKLLKNLAHTIDASTLTRYRDRILDASGGEPWPFLELLARVSKWQYLSEIAQRVSISSREDTETRHRLERHYFKMEELMPYYSRDTGEKNKTLALFQALPEGFLSERFYKQIRFDLK